MKRLTLTLLLAACATLAQAQYVGPSGVPAATVRQLLDHGKDDQHAKLRGRIVSHDGGELYTFADDTGRMTVEIDAKLFPAGQPLDDKQLVELVGELERGFRKIRFDVDVLTILPAAGAGAATPPAAAPAGVSAPRGRS